MKKNTQTGLSSSERKIVAHFSANEQTSIDVDALLGVMSISRPAAHQILSRLERKGWLQRLKRGKYALVPISSNSANPVIEDALPLAMDLFKPAFISGWSAAEHWDLTEQIFNSVSVVTAKTQRQSEVKAGGILFRLRVIPKDRFFGSKSIWFGSKQVEIADPSRMVIDILDLPRFGGGGRHTVDVIREYLKSKHCNLDLLLEYALRYKKGSVFKRLGFLVENFHPAVTGDWCHRCISNLSAGVSLLDPDGPSQGKTSTKWKLRINLPI